jgi:isopentenyldiphosphate isomerase
METLNDSKEMLKIFDDNKNQIGIATREEVHRIGYWHEAFQCWFISREENTDFIYLQLRSHVKKDYPNLLDITAAGHLMANESVQDGTREIKEELGIDVSYKELESLGIIDYCVEREGFIDKEIANVFLYSFQQTFEDFKLQKEEVSGVFKTKFNDFYQLWSGSLEEICITGFKIDEYGNKELKNMIVKKDDFVPHEKSFYRSVIKMIKEKISQV